MFRSGILVALLCVVGTSALGDRLYGNLSFSYQRLRETSPDSLGFKTRTDDLTQESAILNYEDALFTKNQLRLGMNLNRREYSFSSYHEFRPIFYLDLRSFGYTISSSYSPYRRLVTDAAGTRLFYQHFRDWRSSLSTSYTNWPSFGMTYTSNRNWYEGYIYTRDARSSNLVMQSSYLYHGLSYQASFNSLKASFLQGGGTDNHTRTLSSTVGYSKSAVRLGTINTSYSLYTTRRYDNDLLSIKSRTHAVSAMYSSPTLLKFNGNASYSGRFFRTEQVVISRDYRNEIFAGQLSVAPTGYLSFDLTKGYQLGTESGRNQITEYVAFSSHMTRYLRNGVDTRFSVTRTVFQQSDRVLQLADDSTTSRGQYSLDTYYGSLVMGPYNYMKTYLDASLTHNSDPVDPNQRYQMTGGIDTRMNLSRATEARFAYSALYQGSRLRLGHSYSQSYNAGVTYIPESNINVNITYIYSTYNAAIRTKTGSLTGYVSYAFRHAFSMYVSVNRQEQIREELVGVPTVLQRSTLRPQSVNAQMIMYLSRRTTLSISYLYTKSPSLTVGATTNRSLQTILNIQV
ncbi:MAG: hypothetical protein AB1644_07965 [Candidatus Zixiibacteriota bacterium]